MQKLNIDRKLHHFGGDFGTDHPLRCRKSTFIVLQLQRASFFLSFEVNIPRTASKLKQSTPKS